jgi:hypothetical protein
MKLTITAGLAALVTALVLGNALAGPPAQLPYFGATRAQPIAGQRFIGLTASRTNTEKVVRVVCRASLAGKKLVGRAQKFYDGPLGLTTIACAWEIPKGSEGKLLVATMPTTFTDGYYGGGGPYKWRVK